MKSLATVLLQALKDHGAREIFGIPGDFVLPFYKVVESSGFLPHYELSHEPAVGFAADAAARFHLHVAVRRGVTSRRTRFAPSPARGGGSGWGAGRARGQ